jgi:exopolysaccharide production protein ExoQ
MRTAVPPLRGPASKKGNGVTLTREPFWKRPLTPRTLAFLFLVLALTPEVKFRNRDPNAAFSGVPDIQVLIELAIWGLVAAWVGWHAARGIARGKYRLSTLGLPMAAVLLTTAVVLVTGANALSVRSTIRAFQYIELVGMTLIVFWEAQNDREFFPVFWRWIRRGMISFAAFAIVATALIPGWMPWTDDNGAIRYTWFEIHPIVTAGMLGLVILMLASIYLQSPDPLFLRKGWKMAAGALGAVFTFLILQTRSRGSLVATAAAVLILLLSPRRGRRRLAAIAAAAIIAASLTFLLAAGSEQVEAWVLRGQTWEQFTTLSQRTELFEIGGDLFAQEPIFGHGYLLAGPLLRTHYTWAGHAHNVLLEIAISMGSVGVLAFSFLLIVIIARLWQGTARAPTRRSGLPAEGFAILLLLIGQGVISDGFGGPVGFETAALMLAALIASQFTRTGQHWHVVASASP